MAGLRKHQILQHFYFFCLLGFYGFSVLIQTARESNVHCPSLTVIFHCANIGLECKLNSSSGVEKEFNAVFAIKVCIENLAGGISHPYWT
jgi:hypothetical protein